MGPPNGPYSQSIRETIGFDFCFKETCLALQVPKSATRKPVDTRQESNQGNPKKEIMNGMLARFVGKGLGVCSGKGMLEPPLEIHGKYSICACLLATFLSQRVSCAKDDCLDFSTQENERLKIELCPFFSQESFSSKTMGVLLSFDSYQRQLFVWS